MKIKNFKKQKTLCQEYIRKFPGQHYIEDQHCAEQGNWSTFFIRTTL